MKEKEKIHKLVIESFKNLIIQVFDRELKIAYISNYEKMESLGYKPTEMLNKTIDEAYPDDIVSLYKSFWALTLKGYTNSLTVEHYGFVWLQKFVPLTGTKGEIVGGMVVSEDITEAQKISKENKERELKILQMSWIASHNFRRPIASLKGIINLLSEEVSKNEDKESDMHLLIQKTKIMLNELDDVIHKINSIAENVWDWGE